VRYFPCSKETRESSLVCAPVFIVGVVNQGNAQPVSCKETVSVILNLGGQRKVGFCMETYFQIFNLISVTEVASFELVIFEFVAYISRYCPPGRSINLSIPL
jgi:hypothetical protein